MQHGYKNYRRIQQPAKGSKPPRHINGEMNVGESAYAALLDLRFRAGEIAGWWFESFSIHLAPKTSIRPDFMIQHNDGAIEFHEVKGGKNHVREDGSSYWGYWAEEDARLKLKIAAQHAPFPIYVVYPKKGGHKNGWLTERVGVE